MSSKRRGSRVYVPPKEPPISAAAAKRRKSVSSSKGRRKSVSGKGRRSSTSAVSTPVIVVVGLYYQLKDGRVGQVRYIGETNFAIGIWYGLQLLPQFKGRNSGSVQGTDYFKCDHKQGIFVRESSVSKRVTSKEIIVMKADYERTRRGSVDLASEVSGSAAVSPLAGTSVSPLPMLPTAVERGDSRIGGSDSSSSITMRETTVNHASTPAGSARRGSTDFSMPPERNDDDSDRVEQLLVDDDVGGSRQDSDAGMRGSNSDSSSLRSRSAAGSARVAGSTGSSSGSEAGIRGSAASMISSDDDGLPLSEEAASQSSVVDDDLSDIETT